MDGVWYIPLVDIETGLDLPRSIARHLQITLPDPEQANTQLLEHLQGYECLLILDNFEHLLRDQHAVDFVHGLVEQCPAIRLLITSA